MQVCAPASRSDLVEWTDIVDTSRANPLPSSPSALGPVLQKAGTQQRERKSPKSKNAQPWRQRRGNDAPSSNTPVTVAPRSMARSSIMFLSGGIFCNPMSQQPSAGSTLPARSTSVRWMLSTACHALEGDCVAAALAAFALYSTVAAIRVQRCIKMRPC